MKTELSKRLRAILQSHPDGLPVSALMDMTGQIYRANVFQSLKKMPDAYIDRWEPAIKGYKSIWCVVVPPDNCPHPTREVVAVRARRWRDSREDEREADQDQF